jgi:cysteine desulfurase/selenocysteine lyase
LAENTTQQYELTREKVAQFINAKQSSEIIFVAGATAGINFVASTWGQMHIQKDDEIILTELEHHSNLVPWQQLALKKEAKLKFIPVTQDGYVDVSDLDSIITKKTKLVAINHVSNALGTHVAVEPIIKAARAVGAQVLLDSCQAVPHMRVDVQKLDCDFLVFSGHKMLAPTGVGVLYIKKEMQHEVPPYQFGGGMVLEAEYTHATWVQPPQKYEAGTPPIAQVIGLGAALDYLNEQVNFDELQKHEAQLCAQLIDGLQTIKGARILGPIEELKKSGHLVSFTIDGYHPHDIAAYLDRFGICVRAGHYCAQPLAKKLDIDSSVRISFYLYNSPDDVDAILQRLQSLAR